jgi:small subunit ribosomal protein S16
MNQCIHDQNLAPRPPPDQQEPAAVGNFLTTSSTRRISLNEPFVLKKSLNCELSRNSSWQASVLLPTLPATRFRAHRKRRIIMAVAIRLNRKGTKDRPYYKIVAVDSRKRRDGRYIEQLGTYDPLIDGTNFSIDLEKADKWLSVGAKASETVASIIRKARTAATKG